MSKGLILVIDDEPQIQKLLGVILRHAGYDVLNAADGRSGLAELVYKKPEAVLLDMGLPDMDGFEVLTRIREISEVVVIMVSVRGQEDIKVKCLESGADDYVTKPFSATELTARLAAVLRRKKTGETGEDVFENAGLKVEFSTRTVTVRQKPVKLTAIEFHLLTCLIKSAGRIMTVRQILRDVWGTDNDEKSNSVRVYFNHLRQKIEDDPSNPKRIVNEPGIGYRFNLI